MPDTPSPTVQLADAPPAPVITPAIQAPLEQVSAAELADLRRRADKYRFLFKTIVTVTSILIGATLIVCIVALLIDP